MHKMKLFSFFFGIRTAKRFCTYRMHTYGMCRIHVHIPYVRVCMYADTCIHTHTHRLLGKKISLFDFLRLRRSNGNLVSKFLTECNTSINYGIGAVEVINCLLGKTYHTFYLRIRLPGHSAGCIIR